MVQRTVLLQRVSGALSVINGVAKFLPEPDAADEARTDGLLFSHGDVPTAAPRRPARGALLLTLAVLAGLMLYRRPRARTGASLDALIADGEE